MADPNRQYVKLNTLESVILNAEDSAEDARWQQASIVRALLDDGAAQREIAAGWINGRTGKPYAQQHVSYVKQVWERWGTSELVDRPDWTSAYYTVQQRSDELVSPDDRRRQWSDAHESRVPKSTASAEKFVENLQDAPPGIIQTIVQGAREVQENRYHPPQERERRRKAGEAFAHGVVQPIADAFGKNMAIVALEEALEELGNVETLTAEDAETILRLTSEIVVEVQVKRAMEGVR